MANFIVRWLVNVFALFLVINIAPGVSVDSWQGIVAAAFVLALFNTFLKPAIVLLTLPFNVLTLGVFTLFINGGILYLVAKTVKGFHVTDFWYAFWAALVYSVVSFVLNLFFSPGVTIDTRFYRRAPMRRPEPGRQDDVIDVEGRVEYDKREGGVG